MALTDSERELLARIDVTSQETARKVEAIDERTKAQQQQITELFSQGRLYAENISTLKAQHDLCKKQFDPGNMAERKNNVVTIIAVVTSCIFGLLSMAGTVIMFIRSIPKGP